MSHNTARIGRRRRVLKEQVLTAGSTPREDLVCTPGDTPRYGAGANIENHPQVTDLVPRKLRSIALILGLGITAGVTAELSARYADSLSSLVPAISAAEITSAFANQLTIWTSAAVLLLTTCYTKLIFSLRRHRVDDVRGRYRIWRLAGWAAIVLSLNTVVGAHSIISRILGHFTGWSVLSGNAGWWLAAAALLGGTLLLKLILDVAECRSAAISYMLAMGCFVVAAATSAGWSPAWAASSPETMARIAPLSGNLLLLVGSLLYARYVVLDVQGLIEHRVTPEQSISDSAAVAAKQTKAEESDPAPAEEAVAAKIAPDETAWVDGSEMHSDEDSYGERRLSKAERKRLRKQKNRRAA